MRIILTHIQEDNHQGVGYSFYDETGQKIKGILLRTDLGATQDARLWFDDEHAGKTVRVHHEHAGDIGTVKLEEEAIFNAGFHRRRAEMRRLESEMREMEE